MSATTTITACASHRRTRSFSLSLISRYPSPLLNLPVELVFEILQAALVHTKPSVLATISKCLTDILNSILYHTVTLDTARRASLFIRGVQAKPSLLVHLRHFALTTPAISDHQWSEIWSILPNSKGLLSLTLDDGEYISSSASQNLESLSSLTIREFAGAPATHAGSPISRLRICEPSLLWYSPRTILSSIGCLGSSRLSHLQLSRSLNGNEENDEIFVAEVKQILCAHPQLKSLVVSLFPATWTTQAEAADVTQSNIGSMLKDFDERLVVVKGEYDEWLSSSPW